VLESVAGGRADGFISCHSIAETYSVLTSLPLVPRLLPAEAEQIIEENLRAHFQMISVTRAMYDKAVDSCVRRSLPGGKVYDALLLECARKARCRWIYTFNVDDFRRLAPDLEATIAAP
jgi:predicted nucleic acid-binding protein